MFAASRGLYLPFLLTVLCPHGLFAENEPATLQIVPVANRDELQLAIRNGYPIA